MNEVGSIISRESFRWRSYAVAALLVIIAIGAGSVLRRLPHANLSLLFLLAVLIVAAVWGLWPSIFATVLSFLAINFFFTVPVYSFTVEEEGDLASIVFFFAMAALTANLASRMRSEMAESRSALGRVSTLLDLSGKMSGVVRVDDALEALSDAILNTLDREVGVWLPDERGELRRAMASRNSLRQLDVDALDGDMLERGTIRQPQSDGTADQSLNLLLLELTGGQRGIVAIGGMPLSAEERKFAEGLCEQAGLAVKRVLLVDDLRAAQLAAQTEQLRSALLASVSHDLRTPLASIIGSVSSVLEYRDILTPEDQRDLLQTVLDESQRLNRYIQNLLDMTRFGAQEIELRREWVDWNDIVSVALERFGPALQKFDVAIDISPAASLIYVHGTLIEQVLVNILDNASDFSEPGGAIRVSVYLDGDSTVIDVSDQGPGIPEDEREKVFEMFYMAGQPDDRRHGVGLGLAICRSIVEAHGGTIQALPAGDAEGTCMRIRLPVAENPIGHSDD